MDDAEQPTTPSSWQADDAEALERGRRRLPLGLLAIGALVLVGIVVVAVSRIGDLEPTEKAWPEIGSRPAGLGEPGAADAAPTAEPGAYLWRDFDGWHLWVVNGEGVAGVSGTLTSDADLARARLAAPGTGEVTTDGEQATFELTDDVPVVGIDFEPDFFAEELEIDLRTEAGPLDPTLLRVRGEPAASMPLRIEKVEVDAAEE
jgi:hypothetical protein